MSVFRNCRDMVTRPGSQVHWIRLVIAFIGLVGISFGVAVLLSFAKSKLDINLLGFELLAYASVFISSLIANLTIIAPVPFAIAIMASAARDFNPVLVALCAAVGGTLGELSGYYAGLLGQKIAIPESIVGYKKVEGWVNKYGFWAIMILGIQPVIPFDLGGLIAGAGRMPLIKFLPALFLGKFPKYLIITFAALGLINIIHLPLWLS
jgi:membrane protein YqaA with SNARE-associated domain